MKKVVRKTKIKYGEIDTQNWVVRPKFSIDEQRKRKYLIKDTLKDGLKRFLQFLKFN